MAGNVFQTLLQMVVDKDSFNAVDSVLGKIDDGITAVNDKFVSIGKFAHDAASEIVSSIGQAVGAIDPLQDRLDQLDKTTFVPKIEVDTTQAQKEVDDFFAQLDSAGGGGGGGGVGVTSIRRLGGAARSLGLDELGGEIQKLGAAAQVGKFVGQLNTSLLDLANQVPGVTSAVAKLAPQLGVTAAQFVVIGGVVAVVGIALVAVTSILGALAKQAEDAHKSLEAGLDAQHEYYELIKKGSADAVQAKRDELLAKEAADKAQAADLQKLYDEASTKLHEAQVKFGGEGAGEGDPNQDPNVIAYLESTRKKLEAEGLLAAGQKITFQTTDDLKKRLDELGVSEKEAGTWAANYQAALDGGTLVSKKAEKGEDELLKKRADALDKLTNLEAKWDEVAAAAVNETNQINEDRRTQSTREEEDHNTDLEREQVAHDAKMLEMQTKGDKDIEDEKQQNIDKLKKADDTIQKLYDSLSDITNAALKKENKLNAEFYKSQNDNVEKHNEDLQKIDETANKNRIKILQQLALDLRDAEVANDVIAFVAAKNRAKQQLDEVDQNTADAKKAEQERFDDQQKKEQEAHDQKIKDIEDQAELDRQKVIENINLKQQERDALKVQLDQEEKDLEQKIADRAKAEQDAFDLKQKQDKEDRDTKLKRQAEDDAIEDKRRQDKVDKELLNINKEIAAAQTSFDIINAAWKGGALGVASYITNTIGNALTGLISQAQQLNSISSGSNPYGPPATSGSTTQNPFDWFGTNYPPSSSGSSGGGSGPYTPTSFAGGGIRDRATWARFGDVPNGMAEAAIPFKKSEGIEAALTQYGIKSSNPGDTYVVNLNGDIADNVGPEFVKTTIETALKGVAAGIAKAKKP